MYKLLNRKFVGQDGCATTFLEITPAVVDASWAEKQNNSVNEYIQNTVELPESIVPLYKLFGNYIAAALYGKAHLRVLDVGCGIGVEYPEYAKHFGAPQNEGVLNEYIGLDPIRHNIDRRKYLFICGRIEDVVRELDEKFDVFVFSTSLDHFEDIVSVAGHVKSLANDNAICVFWVGLHDPVIVAEQAGVTSFKRAFSSLNPALFFLRYFFMLIRLPGLYFSLLKRSFFLKNDKPLDKLHFQYFTSDSIGGHLRNFGDIVDAVHVPGTNSMFLTVSIGN